MGKNKTYDEEYKIQAVKLGLEIGAAKAARELGISSNTLQLTAPFLLIFIDCCNKIMLMVLENISAMDFYALGTAKAGQMDMQAWVKMDRNFVQFYYETNSLPKMNETIFVKGRQKVLLLQKREGLNLADLHK